MELFGIASILGKLAMTEAAKAAVAGVKNQLHPDRMELILKNAIESAQAAEALLSLPIDKEEYVRFTAAQH
jgi:hypothetical protein